MADKKSSKRKTREPMTVEQVRANFLNDDVDSFDDMAWLFSEECKSCEDWCDVGDKCRDLYNQLFDEDVEKNSLMDDFFKNIAAQAYNIARDNIARALSIPPGPCIESCIEVTPRATCPVEWQEHVSEWLGMFPEDKAVANV